MSRRMRFALAGAGFVGALHARSGRLAGGELVGVAASTPERSQEAAARLGATRAFTSAEALADAADVEVVHICTPNDLHLPLAEAALAAGKHVICEKPLATDAGGARRLVDAAAAAGTVAAVPFVYRFYATAREARARVMGGVAGDVRLLHGTYLQDWLLRPEDDNWRVDAARGGASRAFADIGSHWCDLAEFVSGHRIARLSARMLTAIPQRMAGDSRHAFVAAPAAEGGAPKRVTTEDAVVVQFETDRGAIGSVVVSQISAGRKNRLWLEVDGSQASLVFDQESAESLWQGEREAATIVRRDPAHLSPAAARVSSLPAGHPEGYANCFDAFVADAYAAIRDGRTPDGLPQFADGLRAATITDAVLASAREHRWIDVPPAGAGETAA